MIRVTPGRETMNIPEMNNEMKQGMRSENVSQAQAVDKPHVREGSLRPGPDAVQKQAEAQEDKQPRNRTKDEIDSLVK